MSQFGKEAEDRLIGWMRQVQGLVSGGDDPTQAIIKVAKDNQADADMLPLMVQAYNTGRQTYQRDKCATEGEGILCKVAEFPIARIEDVREALYPAKKAEAIPLPMAGISDEYSRAPRPFLSDVAAAREKVASALPRMAPPPKPIAGDPTIKMSKMIGQKERIERQVKQAQQDQRTTRSSFLLALGQLGDYFKQAEYSRLPMQEVGFNANAMFGPAALDALTYAAHRNGQEVPDFTKAPKIARPVEPTKAPYSLVEDAILWCKEAIDASAHSQQLEKEATLATEALMRPFAEAPAMTPTRVLDSPETWEPKQAFLSGLMAGITGGTTSGIARGLFAPKPTKEILDDTEMELSDPSHLDELTRIEARVVLNDMVANDETISGFDPDEVTEAYNEILATAPSLATQPLALRPILRRRLSQGTLEAMDAQQAAEIEKTIRQTNQGGRADEPRSAPVLV